jgi:hypothetical protein
VADGMDFDKIIYEIGPEHYDLRKVMNIMIRFPSMFVNGKSHKRDKYE